MKQEVAKEGILPFSDFFASGTTTPAALLKAWWSTRKSSGSEGAVRSLSQNEDPELNRGSEQTHLEQSPMAALLLHWLTSVTLIAITAMLTPSVAYSFLVSLYVYVIVILMGFIVSVGLLYLKVNKNSGWANETNFRPWGGPTATILYG